MNLEEKVMEQLKQAMRDKNQVAMRTLRSIKAALLEEHTAVNAKDALSDEDEIRILQKMAKQRKDSKVIFESQKRNDLAQIEADELEILESFLPQQIEDDQLVEKLKGIIAQAGASSPADMGKVMGIATKSLAGQADGARIAAITRTLLNKG